ncbi:MAG: carboxypeptidase-like regulatory domain-containing protein, partial [Phaeodactylibacter sp.]|nr:carboxypeptidase-like regulatory domain-containing protein [Phaeodactylibacter sp.]
MKKPLLPFLTCVFALLSFSLTAQKTITGEVKDVDGVPLIGVNVIEVGTSNGTVTDLDGRYTVKVAGENAELSFRYTGLTTVTRSVAGTTTINVEMEEN